ncbi:MAG TPA: VIT domain-containing protein, partial [Kofleriaceae bacterium]
LTASDGSGLLLTRVDAKAVFEGPLAFTELHLYFHNPENRVREGTFQITLPQRAAVSRFAMENHGQWMEAEVVEKQLARRAYDDFLHRRQDPALLEKAAGNQFTAKVFPIAGKTDKHLVISYSQELPGAQYVLPLRGLPKTERVDVSLALMSADGKRTEQQLTQRNWQPDRDFVSSAPSSAPALLAGNLVAAQVEIGDRAAAADKPANLTLLVDTSASRALGYAAYVASVRALVDAIETKYGAGLPLQVVAFDQDAEAIYAGRAADFGDAHVKKLVERGAAGASDLGQAFAWLAQHAPHQRVVVVTDGVVTAGAEGAALQGAIKALAPAKVERIDFVLAGGLRDEPAMTALVRSGLPRAGAVLDLDRDPVAAALGEAVQLDVEIRVPGALWTYPTSIASARAGTRTMVYARLPKPQQAIEIKVAGKSHRLQAVAGTAPLVERALASAEIDELEARLAKTTVPNDATKLRETIARKSIATRVISSQTSLLVLESDADFARYGIDRKALADVLVVGPNGIERKGRPAPAQLAQPEPRLATKKQPSTADRLRQQGDLARAKLEERLEKEGVKGAQGQSASATAGAGLDEGVLGKRLAEEPDSDEGGVEGGVVGGEVGGIAAAEPAKPEPAPTTPPATGRRESSLRGDVAVRHRRVNSAHASAERAEAQRQLQEARQRASRAERLQGVRISAEAMNNPLATERDVSGVDGRLRADSTDSSSQWPPKDAPPALTGELAEITKLLKRDVNAALSRARDWHAREPGNVLALIGLGEALEAKGSKVTAARVYGSIIDLFPGRVDMRRFAGERLTRLQSHAKDLIVDTYRRAVADRPDHLNGHRLLAYALLRAGKHAEAFDAILAGVTRSHSADRFAGVKQVLADDAGMIGAAYAAALPAKRNEVQRQLTAQGLGIATKPSTRFILYWETDANDVDFHIQDAKGNHAFYSDPKLRSGGELYADVTTGYGPECFAIAGTPKAGPYRVSIDYYSQGPMGYGMGLLEVQRFDGKGGLTFEARPYVIMNAHAFVDLGTVQ